MRFPIPSFKTRLVVSIAMSNFLVILFTLIDNMSLVSVAQVFWLHAFIRFLFNIFRILSAEHANHPSWVEQSLLASKLISLAIFICMNGLLLAAYFMAFFTWLNPEESVAETVIFIAKCSALALFNNFIMLREERAHGLHKELLEDAELARSVIPIQLVLLPCLFILGSKRAFDIDYTDYQFLGVLLTIALCDSVVQIIRAEKFEKRLRSAGRQPARAGT